jgi:5'-deoxynucleotidase
MIEKDAVAKALSKLPEELKANYSEILGYEQNQKVKKIVKSADKLCAYLKCVQEYKNGNLEFKQALKTTEKAIADMATNCKELEYFMQNFAKPFEQSIDEL